MVSSLAGSYPSYGYNDGAGTEAQFNSPVGIAIDSNGIMLFIADSSNNRVRMITGILLIMCMT